MRRREVIILLDVAATFALAARAQQSAIQVVGFLRDATAGEARLEVDDKLDCRVSRNGRPGWFSHMKIRSEWSLVVSALSSPTDLVRELCDLLGR